MALRGINLGGWLIVERWMTPEVFEGVNENGERAIGKELPDRLAQQRIDSHRKKFITEKDVRWIAHHGFDFVRLPVGYWLFEEDAGFISGEAYVEKAFVWAERYGLKVVLDFHGLQGSQNGQDHSGQVGKVMSYKRNYERRALLTVDYLTKKYGHHPALLAIELINEPKVRWFIHKLLRYYTKAFKIAEANVAPSVRIIVSDAFKPLRLARALARRHLGEQLVLDVHLYQLFSPKDQEMSLDEHLQLISTQWLPLIQKVATYMPVLIGEWSAALPAKVLQEGRQQEIYQEYFNRQLAVFDKASWAHSYWSYKAPGSGPWSYQDSAYLHWK